jgi:tetratricopeptide (TPR) repeat protein
MRNTHLLAAALSAALALPLLANAAEAATGKVDPLALATVLIEHGEAAKACTLLDVVYGTRTANARALYLMGECRLSQGQAAKAATFYERALRQQPKAVGIRAKLVGVYIRLGRTETARKLLAAAPAADPGNRSAIVLADLVKTNQPGVVAVKPPKNWSGEVSLSRLYDSNANGGSIASTVDAIIGGVPLTLDISPSSKAKPDWGTVFSANGSTVQPLDAHYGLILRGDVSATIYDDESDYSRQSIGAGAGLLYRDPRLTWSVLPNVRYSWQGGDPDELIAAVDGRINYRITQQLSITGAAQAGYASVPFDHDRDSWIGLAAAGLDYAFNPAVRGGVQIVARRSAGEMATEANTGIGPEVYLSAALTDMLTFDASYSFTHVEYDESLAVFPTGRRDNRQTVSVGLNLDLSQWQQGLSAFARYNYVHTDSTVALYTSDRHLVAAGLRYRF